MLYFKVVPCRMSAAVLPLQRNLPDISIQVISTSEVTFLLSGVITVSVTSCSVLTLAKVRVLFPLSAKMLDIVESICPSDVLRYAV